MAIWPYLLFAFLAGAMLPIQFGINAQLASWLHSPLRATLVSFAVGTVVLLLAMLAADRDWPPLERIGNAPWWVWVGGLLGLCGVALIFWPELGRAAGREGASLGALFTAGAVLLSAVGSLTASRNRLNGLPFWPALGFGMLYGAGIAVPIALAQGFDFVPPTALSWWASLLYLTLAGSVLTFACYLTLLGRVVWCRRDGTHYRIGAQFDPTLDAQHRRRLDRLVRRLLGEDAIGELRQRYALSRALL